MGKFLSGIGGGNQFLKSGYADRDDFISIVNSFMKISKSFNENDIDDRFVYYYKEFMSFKGVSCSNRIFYWMDSLKFMYSNGYAIGIDPYFFCFGKEDFFDNCIPVLNWVLDDYSKNIYLEKDLYVLSGIIYPFSVDKIFFLFVINKFIYYYQRTGEFNYSKFLFDFFNNFGDIMYLDSRGGPSSGNKVRFRIGQNYDFDYVYTIHLFRAIKYFFYVCEIEDIFGLYNYHRYKHKDLFCDAMNRLIVNEEVLAKLGIVFNKNLE